MQSLKIFTMIFEMNGECVSCSVIFTQNSFNCCSCGKVSNQSYQSYIIELSGAHRTFPNSKRKKLIIIFNSPLVMPWPTLHDSSEVRYVSGASSVSKAREATPVRIHLRSKCCAMNIILEKFKYAPGSRSLWGVWCRCSSFTAVVHCRWSRPWRTRVQLRVHFPIVDMRIKTKTNSSQWIRRGRRHCEFADAWCKIAYLSTLTRSRWSLVRRSLLIRKKCGPRSNMCTKVMCFLPLMIRSETMGWYWGQMLTSGKGCEGGCMFSCW